MDTTTITFALRMPGGGPVTGGKVTAVLSGYDLDDGIVVGGTVEAQIAADGTGSMELWPNVVGTLGTTSYKITVTPSAGTKFDLTGVVVPVSDTPVMLQSLIQGGRVADLTSAILTQAQYNALPVKDPQILYLIVGA
ncbi:hypothetical protein D2T29_22255 [Sinirhodobacter populi]|uniref:Minor tail protein gp31 C-terminal domain-containing protein n=1 Tax=Paenirhodobacter populi TaxID=2306993 RepID=A0A443JXL0_9RHOB|nr:hypothetical protein [Sinirhodobacter populi]RWR25214.1 hypothetical protein D2T29_22255 [Sinirhodobacter populi]